MRPFIFFPKKNLPGTVEKICLIELFSSCLFSQILNVECPQFQVCCDSQKYKRGKFRDGEIDLDPKLEMEMSLYSHRSLNF